MCVCVVVGGVIWCVDVPLCVCVCVCVCVCGGKVCTDVPVCVYIVCVWW